MLRQENKSYGPRTTYTDTLYPMLLSYPNSLTYIPRLCRLISVLPLQYTPGYGYVSTLLEQHISDLDLVWTPLCT